MPCLQLDFPRVTFSNVYMITLDNGNRVGYLVEPMLDIKTYHYQEFNDNQGSALNALLAEPPRTKKIKDKSFILETSFEGEP
jgi:hypothetical protein